MSGKIVKLGGGGETASTPSRFKSGDVVVLRSGGNFMTARSIEKDGAVMCDWQLDDGTPATLDYLPVMLLHAHEYEAMKEKAEAEA